VPRGTNAARSPSFITKSDKMGIGNPVKVPAGNSAPFVGSASRDLIVSERRREPFVCAPNRADALKFTSQFKATYGNGCLHPVMEKRPPSQNDACSYCQIPLEIVSVKIGLAHVTMQYVCPNCGVVRADESGGKNSGRKNRSRRRLGGPMSFLGKRR